MKTTPTPLKEALNLLVANTPNGTQCERISLFEACGRILAQRIDCVKPLPAFDNSAMDGYGVKLCDAGHTVKVSGAIFAGQKGDEYTVVDGETVKVMTGAPIPAGCEAIVPFEDATITDTGVQLPSMIKNAAHIRRKGEEFALNAKLLPVGSAINAGAVGLLASQGRSFVDVYAKPRVAVLSTGQELCEPWDSAQEHQIYNSNAATIYSLVKEFGGEPHYVKILGDTLEETVRSIESLNGFDAVITSGGISMGEADFVGAALKKAGMRTVFASVQIKPGKPTMFGLLDRTCVLALPGNPLSAIVNFYLFAAPMLSLLGGGRACHHSYSLAKSAVTFQVKSARANVIVGSMKHGEFTAYNGAAYGSGMLGPIAYSDSFIILDEGVREVQAGQTLKVMPLAARLVDVEGDFFS